MLSKLLSSIHDLSKSELKPGPKRKAESTGETDKRQKVTKENAHKHPTLEIKSEN